MGKAKHINAMSLLRNVPEHPAYLNSSSYPYFVYCTSYYSLLLTAVTSDQMQTRL